MGKRILITGGAGFIGSHLCENLLNKTEDFIICLDNFYTGRKENIERFLKNPRFKLLEHDIVNPLTEKVDEIYNLACPASPIHYQNNPVKTLKTSVLGIINMLELAKANNAKLLQASTSEVYGNPLLQTETYWGNVNPIGIRSCYDEGKRCAETLIMDYRRMYNLNVKIVRIFNTFGERMAVDDGRVVSNFINQAIKGDDITVYGDGAQTRSFCYVSDLIDGIVKMMNSDDNFVGPINLGNPTEKTVLELANMIVEMTKSDSKIVFKELPLDDPIKRNPDISLAKNVLGWTPKIDIQKGLENTISYFIKIMKDN